MLKKLFRRNPYTTAIKKDIAEIKAMSKQYEETRKQVLKNVETIVSVPYRGATFLNSLK